MNQRIFSLTAALLAGCALLAAGCKRKSTASVDLAMLLPPDTAAVVTMSDLPRTRERCKSTALAKILAEPEVAAFLKKPLANAKAVAGWNDWLARLDAARPVRGFLALRSQPGRQPTVLGACFFKGEPSAVDALRNAAKERLHKAKPAGHADLVQHGEVAIETFAFDNQTIATASHASWLVAGNDVEWVKATLDRLNRPDQSASLAADPLYQEAIAPLTKDAEGTLFVRMTDLVERLATLMEASGNRLSPAQLAQMRKVRAMSAAVQLDGANIRDTLFVLESDPGKTEPIRQTTLAMTTADTVLYATARWAIKESELDQALAGNPALAAMLGPVRNVLEQKNIRLGDLGTIFGPESSVILDWPAKASAPSLVFALGVRDRARAEAVADTFVSGALGNPAWERRESGGATFHLMTGSGLVTVTPTLAVTDDMLYLGLGPEAVANAIRHRSTPETTLEGNAAFKQAANSVPKAEDAFVYLDTAVLFDRVYSAARPLLMMAAAFSPDAAKHVDLAKLPATDTICKHLGPIVYSLTSLPSGRLAQSAGPVTLSQALVGTMAVVGVTAVPIMKSRLGTAVVPGMNNRNLQKPGVQPSAQSLPGGVAPVSGDQPATDAQDQPAPDNPPAAPEAAIDNTKTSP